VTTFFEPINLSAVHIYHSALELSPLSSVVRRLYYHRRHTPFPRVVTGAQDSWDQSSSTRFGGEFDRSSFTWSPCGQLVAANYRGVAEIRDPHTSELLSTLQPTKPVYHPICPLAYSQDGRSLAALSYTSLMVWDVQTGGMAREVECDTTTQASLVWSLDGRAIGTILLDKAHNYIVRVYDIDSGATQSPGALRSTRIPHLWAHDKSFRVMTEGWDDQTRTIDISEVGSGITRIESFCVGSSERDQRIDSFSPTTYRISTLVGRQFGFRIFDIRNWECLLNVSGYCASVGSRCFSSDGRFFATSAGSVRIWKYASSRRRYTLWREFPAQHTGASALRFSPDLSSIAGWYPDLLRVWRLDHPHVDHAGDPGGKPIGAVSHCGTYAVTGHCGGITVTITDLHSRGPPQFVDTDMEILGLTFTGNVLLVMGGETITAWRVTEEGVVDGVPRDGRMGRSDSIWTIPRYRDLAISIRDQTVVMELNGNVTHAYETGTGEVLDPAQVPPYHNSRHYTLSEMKLGLHYHHRSFIKPNAHSANDWPVSWATLREGWVKDSEGRHRVWIPTEWRLDLSRASWFDNPMARLLNLQGGTVTIKF